MPPVTVTISDADSLHGAPGLVRLAGEPHVVGRVVQRRRMLASGRGWRRARGRARTARSRRRRRRAGRARTTAADPNPPRPTMPTGVISHRRSRPSRRRTTRGCRPSRPPSGRTSHRSRPRDDMPRCTLSQIAQSWRLTRSHRSPASDGSKAADQASGWEQQVAADLGATGIDRTEHERRDVVGGEAQPQVRVHELTLVAGALGVVEGGERGPGPTSRSS